ncbi:MAG TPA: helix-turn-helix domain-containing protein [Bryobacteraceae bacterium]|nr:helix-turn-helix domain-containing protein [Bryobacteraceae bacterium]
MNAFIPLPVLAAEDLSPGAKLCYGILCRYAGQDGRCYPSIQTLAEHLRVSARQARKYVSELVERGYVEREQSSVGETNTFHFLWREEFREYEIPRNDPSGAPRNDCSAKESHLKRTEDSDYRATNRDSRDSLAGYSQLRRIIAEALGKDPSESAFGKVIEAGGGESEGVLVEAINSAYRRGYGPGTPKGPRTARWFEVTIADFVARGEDRRPAAPAADTPQMASSETAELAESFGGGYKAA